MKLSTSLRFTSNTSWVAPAGVTRVLAVPDDGVGVLLTVVPNTSYAVVAASSPGSLGSLYAYKTNATTGYITLVWMD